VLVAMEVIHYLSLLFGNMNPLLQSA